MLPRLGKEIGLDPPYPEFLRELRSGDFSGDIHSDIRARLVNATDNSVYQILPQAIVCPRTRRDVVVLAKLAAESRFRGVTLTARGGGTGTNGQALTEGIVVDLSRHMSRVIEINTTERWVRVEPGVVLDQLNATLAPLGLFFAPTVSPSNRATLGGMVSTDACGKGSRVYGKTSEHVLDLALVLADGTEWLSRPVDAATLRQLKKRPDRIGAIYRTVDEILTSKQALIERQFPKLPRFLTGYDLAHVRATRGTFDLNRLLTGSEGTLAFITEARLALVPIPAHKRLMAISYRCFDDALASAEVLVGADPGAIETVDGKILELARKDPVYDRVGHLLGDPSGERTEALNLVEFSGDDPASMDSKVRALVSSLEARCGQPGQAHRWVVAATPAEAAGLWELRKKGVGLLGNAPGVRRPIAFVEDTAVPPNRLAEYVREFRRLLEDAGLEYGMFGHVDVGCLHVRPALNLRDPSDERLLRRISDRVAELVRGYGGVMWSEHGKGFRSEYSPRFFGEELFLELCRIKSVFDPSNQLNPGKLAVPDPSMHALVSVDGPKRGHFDRQLSTGSLERYAAAVNCNGNGACFDYDPDSVMCPSSKVTRDRVHSPKGRATMMREWLRELALRGYEPGEHVATRHSGIVWDQLVVNGAAREAGEYDFSHEVHAAMDGCLSCKACATQCPIKVDVPELKAEFFDLYYRRYPRPLKDYLLAGLEAVIGWMALLPRLANAFLRARWFRGLLSRIAGLVDTPLLSVHTLRRGLAERGALRFSLPRLLALSESERKRHVLLIQDAFTSFYESHVVLDCYDLLRELGYEVTVVPFRQNGKGLHVKGMLRRFRRLVRANADYFSGLAGLGIPMVGVDPAVTLTYRDEYRRVLGDDPGFRVQLLQEWLVSRQEELRQCLEQRCYRRPPETAFSLMGHCTEKTLEPASQRQWQQLFALFGLELELVAVGCCGMCGVFGHEASHREESLGIYAMSWRRHLPREPELRRRYLAAGHSCRSQVERFDGDTLRHPAAVLLEALRAGFAWRQTDGCSGASWKP
jgi:FAD/FMN-containing dehydrogenase/Fe-S oxidoreductase